LRLVCARLADSEPLKTSFDLKRYVKDRVLRSFKDFSPIESNLNPPPKSPSSLTGMN
jgi:hypothetical protein